MYIGNHSILSFSSLMLLQCGVGRENTARVLGHSFFYQFTLLIYISVLFIVDTSFFSVPQIKPFLLIIIQNWNLERLNTESAYF